MEMEEEVISNKDSIRNRLQRYFLGMTLSVLAVMSVFSLVYFFYTTRNDAGSGIRNKLVLAQVFMETEKTNVKNMAENIANNHAIQLGLQLESPSRISEYLKGAFTNNTSNYSISVFNNRGSALVENQRLTAGEQLLLTNALAGEKSTSTALSYYKQDESPSYVCACPVYYNKDVIGVIIVRFIFTENLDFFINLSKNLSCDLMVYLNAEPVVATSAHSIDKSLYSTVAFSDSAYEKISLTSSGLNEYIGILGDNGTSCGVLHLYVSSIPYVRTFVTAAIVYCICGVIIMILVILLVIKISNGILLPINALLEGVNIVRSGDLKHEIMLGIHDEIGRLGVAFNDMRAQLDEKMTTITDMNESLENKVNERTSTLNKLNENMKHYLSPQLYQSIVGGERDASTSKHYRKKLTVFFSDVKNFTATTESLDPDEISRLLNDYLDKMSEIAEKYGGTIDKYVGDAVMVFFGDPVFTSDKDHAMRAVKMAMEMQQYMVKFRAIWEDKGIANPFHVRMGINTGYCTIGNFGSETKMDYTIIGSNVNLAARFEAAADPDSILMSAETYALVRKEIECFEAGSFMMKGISEPVKGYTPVKLKDMTKQPLAEVEGTKIAFMSKRVDLRNMTKGEKRELLLSIKDVFDTIKKEKDIGKDIDEKPVMKSLDEPEKAQRVDTSGMKSLDEPEKTQKL